MISPTGVKDLKYNNNFPCVTVLMSTYNGERFLKEQIESILNQTNIEIEIIIRDDGSSDGTQSILTEYSHKYTNIKLYFGENVGCQKSFLRLLEISKTSNSKYYAFADQDDIWKPNKLEKAVEQLREEDLPAMYFSSYEIIDYKGSIVGKSAICKKEFISKEVCLAQNMATGCTIVFNNYCRNFILKYNPNYVAMHDFWMYILMNFFGKVIYDKEPYLLYRQHENNVVGEQKSFWKRYRAKALYIKNLKECPRERMASELLKGYGKLMSREDYELVSMISKYKESLPKTMKLLFSKKIRMSNIEDDFWYRIRIILRSV